MVWPGRIELGRGLNEGINRLNSKGSHITSPSSLTTRASSYDVTWFNSVVASCLHGFALNYRYFEQGDFGALHQVEFNSAHKGGCFDFWGMDWLGIYLVDYGQERELFNRLLTDAEEHEKQHAIDTFLALL